MVEDTLKLIELKVQPALRRGKPPDRETGKTVATMLRALAAEPEACNRRAAGPWPPWRPGEHAPPAPRP